MSQSVSKGFTSRQWVTIASLATGYAGYYFCRSNFSLATPFLLEEFGGAGLDKETIGMIASTGILFYAVGKLFNGVLCDFVGGRRVFLWGMLGSILATVFFGLGSGVAVFLVAWSANRLIQSMGWGALVKVTSNWFSFRQYGTVMGFLSLSFLFGDAIARLFLGTLLDFGLGWRVMYFAAAGVLGLVALVNFMLLREKPEDDDAVGEINPLNVYGDKGGEDRPSSLFDLLVPFLSKPSFWLVMVMSVGLTLIRESFNFWTPTYLTETGGLSAAAAGTVSLFFPLFGGVSVLLAGYASDKWAKGKRASVMIPALVLLVPVLFGMGLWQTSGAVMPVVLVSLSALLLIGPYSYLAGAISLDLGGKRGSATAAGLIDSAGYFGGLLSGYGIGSLAQHYGWNTVFMALGGVGLVTAIAAVVYWVAYERGLGNS